MGLPRDSQIPPELIESIDRMERGTGDEAQWLETFRGFVGTCPDDGTLRAAYNMVLGPEIAETAEFVRERVSRGYRVIYFSDTSGAHINWIYRNLSFAHLITGGIFSFEVGAKKPESRMYETFEQKYGVPELYLDDMEKNINAARLRGWNAVQYVCPKQVDS